MTTTVVSVDDLERKATVARVLLDRVSDDLEQLQAQLREEKLDRDALQHGVGDAAYLLYIAIEELDA